MMAANWFAWDDWQEERTVYGITCNQVAFNENASRSSWSAPGIELLIVKSEAGYAQGWTD
jgi:hypothetical protein